ncbi:transcriptional regulator [Methanoplanus sp. FWC-SCC4]|uniref:Transcriptional regulator n=1 Tax=Methanochimaera problematica TaxID=2609417 RepID=A0AA97I3T8_9EURY|nr:transcriptional regulator [Methanoplanus sp. FWC-SCC4]WOF16241.1 transcriptional regulator [Methanoplanus sp. FWC-SCC4]
MTYSLCDIMKCDEVVRLYLPQVRAELVCRLVVDNGIPQAKVARWMGISRAAVSQYVSKKRGFGEIPISAELNEIIDAWAEGVVSGEGSVTICDICQCVSVMNNNQK